MSRRRLSDDERTLWKGVTRSISPLAKRIALDDDDAEPVTPPKPRPRLHAKSVVAAPIPVAVRPAATKPVAPPLAPLTRKMKKRVARGAHEIEGRLDLHGMTQHEAHGALFSFLRGRQSCGCKLVLVITGKGGRALSGGSEGRGILKRMVPLWLALPEFRGLVIGFEAAAIGHGGEGALYVRLRRTRVLSED